MAEKLTGIVLAGGTSSRMGTNKAFIKHKGIYFIDYVINVLDKFCGQILISAANKDFKHQNYKIVGDEIEGGGPIIGIYSALKKSKTDKNIVISCDTPFIDQSFIRFLLSHAQLAPLIVPYFENKPLEPLCAIYSKSITPALEDFINKGKRKIQSFLNNDFVKKIEIPNKYLTANPYLLKNFNTPEDLLELTTNTKTQPLSQP